MGILCKEFYCLCSDSQCWLPRIHGQNISWQPYKNIVILRGREDNMNYSKCHNPARTGLKRCLDMAKPARIRLDKLASQNCLLGEYYVTSLLQIQIHLYLSMIIHQNFVSIVSLPYSNTEHFTITSFSDNTIYKWVLYCYIQNKGICFGWCSVIGKLIRCW